MHHNRGLYLPLLRPLDEISSSFTKMLKKTMYSGKCLSPDEISSSFLLSGGAGGNFAQAWENWQIETVNLSFKVCMHRTRNKCIIIFHHLLQYRRHMENIDTKTRNKKGDKVHTFGSCGAGS